MVPLRLLTWAAILAGAFLGAVAALWSRPSATPHGLAYAAPAHPVAETQVETPSPYVDTSFAVPASAETRGRAPKTFGTTGPRREEPLPESVAAVEEATLRCSRGDDDDCLRAAEAFATGRGVEPDEKRARDFRATAIKRYATRCTRRDPDACHALSMLHARGFGLKQDPDAAKALLERARSACRTRPAAICARL